MRETYQSQFRLPCSLYEKLKQKATESEQSVNALLVNLIAASLADASDETDLKHITEALRRLSLRNPDMHYTVGIDLGDGPAWLP